MQKQDQHVRIVELERILLITLCRQQIITVFSTLSYVPSKGLTRVSAVQKCLCVCYARIPSLSGVIPSAPEVKDYWTDSHSKSHDTLGLSEQHPVCFPR